MKTDSTTALDRVRPAFPLRDRAPAATDFHRPVYCVLGLPFDAISMPEAVARIRTATAWRAPCFLSTPNLNFLVGSRRDAAFRDSVLHSDISVADGVPVVLLARLLGVPIPERVAGSDLFDALVNDDEREMRVYFFGGGDGTARAACERLNSAGGPVRCVGHTWPGTGNVDEMSRPELIRSINQSGADFVIVALGARKGQSWIECNRSRLDAPVVAHLGATVNFAAGTVSRAPPLVRKMGLEWLWRIKEEPALWRRYLTDGARFVQMIATRVVPAILQRVLDAPRGPEKPANIVIRSKRATMRLIVSGSWLDRDLPLLRKVLESITREPMDVALDLRRVTRIDAAFVGTLTLLYGHQSRIGRALRVVRVSNYARRAIELCCAEFLLEGLAAEGGGG